jgi:hypothetical protein
VAAASKRELLQSDEAVAWLIKCAAHPTWRVCFGAGEFVKSVRKASPVICENKLVSESEAKAALAAFEKAITQPQQPRIDTKIAKSAPHPLKRKRGGP